VGQTSCSGGCCPPGQGCFKGCCATNTAGLTLTSNSNYLLTNNCQNIKGLTVSLTAADDMVAAVTPFGGGPATQNGGFTLQLNAYNPAGPTTSWMQYVFLISGNAINYQVQYWDITAACGCVHPKGLCNCAGPVVNLNGTVFSLPSNTNTIPKTYVLKIALDNDGVGNVTGATFSVTDNNGKLHSTRVALDAQHLFPIVAFQVNVGGPDNGSDSQFSPGGGTITYEISSGQLCVEGGLPDLCSKSAGSSVATAETSNAAYGPINPPCCALQLTQSFST
jgi:hypothetical protein